MKIYISADIEGVCGVTNWSEADEAHADYAPFQKQMTAEVAAACEGAIAAGAEEILVRDAHGPGRNVIGEELPPQASLVRAWSGHPFSMVQELDTSFDAAMFIGYHARIGAGGNPLAHTLSSSRIAGMWINDIPTSEYLIHAWAAESVGVPVVFVSGDESLCQEIAAFHPPVRTFAVKGGHGASTLSLHPERAVHGIREGSEAALRSDRSAARLELPERFELRIEYKQQEIAYRRSFYPGARQLTPLSIGLETEDYFEVLRALQFVL